MKPTLVAIFLALSSTAAMAVPTIVFPDLTFPEPPKPDVTQGCADPLGQVVTCE